MSEREATCQSHLSADPIVKESFEARLERPTEPEIYKHQRLDTSTDEIRLLKLVQETNGPVRCEVKVFPFERAPKYFALSYRWGPSSPLCDLYIEGKKLKIRDILYSCLLELREDLEEWLWIDQICVAQADTLERNHQVGMMSHIYRNSISVIIWMGDIPLAAPEEHDRYNDLDLDVVSARVLLKNTYFTRLWIVQEILLADNVEIRINGHRYVTWDRFQSLCITQTELHDVSFRNIPLFLLAFTQREQKAVDLRRQMSLMHYVWCFYEGKCENPRDKVYGLMGMVRKEDGVVVDYRKSVMEVYLDFVGISINKGFARVFSTQRERFEGPAIHYFELGRLMGIGSDVLRGVLRLMMNRFTVHRNDIVTAIGLEKAGQTHEQHNWWYECNGERHLFSCRPLSDSEISTFL
ncbi:unnamed protein product [Alternaria alternata]|jgi:hypothetical protein